MKLTPLALIAELTYRCPLKCVYCSNPTELKARAAELETKDWQRVFGEAAKLGVLQLHLTGGEPTLRDDLTELIDSGRGAGLYTNLITSGVGMTKPKLAQWVAAGLDHVQLSFQDSQEKTANEYSGTKSHAAKLKTADLIRDAKVGFTVNIVIHRKNIPRLESMIEMAEALGPQKLEIAHVQYNGWAFKNRLGLLPTRQQVKETVEIVKSARERLKGKMHIDFVVPDYHAKFPKACMGGWARQMILLNPMGIALPCHSASILPGFEFPNVRVRALKWIWEESPLFQSFRGEQWMKEPCRSCERRTQDFGGCRCQAFMVTGDAAATDPVCSLSSDRPLIDEAIAESAGAEPFKWDYRGYS